MASSIGPWTGGSVWQRGGGDWDIIDPFSSDLWDPFDYGLSGGLNWPGQGGRRSGGDDDVSVLARAYIDWRETDNAHVFRVDLPGVRRENLKVQLEDNILEISGERVKEEEQVNDKWHRMERRLRSFTRRFRLPENVNVDEIECGLEHGVLTVNVPKKETQEVTRNVRAIDIA